MTMNEDHGPFFTKIEVPKDLGRDQVEVERTRDHTIIRVNGVSAAKRDERTAEIVWAPIVNETERKWLIDNVFAKYPPRHPDGNRRQRRWNARAMKMKRGKSRG